MAKTSRNNRAIVLYLYRLDRTKARNVTGEYVEQGEHDR